MIFPADRQDNSLKNLFAIREQSSANMEREILKDLAGFCAKGSK
jgi:hypothetical protein